MLYSMSVNNTHVTKAREHLAAVEASIGHLHDLYSKPWSNERGERVAESHQRIREGSKLAEVNALLAIADAVEALRRHVPHHTQEATLL